jgi:hypothetical protein
MMTDPCDSWPYHVPYGLGRGVIPADRSELVTLENFEARTATPKLAVFLNHIRTDWSHWRSSVDWTLESGPDDAPSSIEIEVPYSLSGGGSDYFMGGCWHPGDPLEIETGTAWFIDETGARCEVVLLEPEYQRVELHIAENPPESDFGDDW